MDDEDIRKSRGRIPWLHLNIEQEGSQRFLRLSEVPHRLCYFSAGGRPFRI